MDRFKKVAAEEVPVKGVYKGFVANIVRNVGGACVLVFYDRAKIYFGILSAFLFSPRVHG